MSYIVGMSDNIPNYASTSALSAVDVTAAVDGKIVLDGQLAAVTGGRMYIYVKSSSATVSATILAATGGGRWYEYFAYTGQTYILVDDATNDLTLTDGSVTLADLSAGITPSHICVAAGTGTYAGGSTTATFTITGMVNTDVLVVNKVTNANASYIITTTHSSTTASILLNTDPGASTFSYTLMRAAA